MPVINITNSCLVLLAVFLLKCIAISSTSTAVAIILISSFSMGIFQAVGLPILIPKAVSEFLAILLFVKAMYIRIRRHESILLLGFVQMAGVVGAGLLSGLLHGTGSIPMLLFLRDMLKFYLLFLGILNLNMSRSATSRLTFLIVILFAVQIPVSWAKLVTVGIDEHWIGTVHMNAGQLSVMLPVFACSFLLATYLYHRQTSYLVWIVFFFVFSIIGEKRAAVFLFPSLILFLICYYRAVEKWPRWGWPFLSALRQGLSPRSFVVVVIMGILVLHIGGRMIPSLNPEEKFGGSFDLKHIMNYTLGYNLRKLDDPEWNNPDFKHDQAVQMGRFVVIMESLRRLREADVFSTLFGFGGGAFSTSYLSGHRQDVLFERTEIRGATPGMVRVFLECGVIGLGFMFWFYLRFYSAIQRQLFRARQPAEKSFALGMLGAQAVFIVDFLTYSSATMFFGVLTPTYFFLLALLLKGQVVKLPVVKPRFAVAFTQGRS